MNSAEQVRKYLSEYRGIGLKALPSDIRHHPAVYHFKAERDYPAMIAALRDSVGQITAIQSTFIDPHTGDKAKITSPKLCMGIVKEAAIKLANYDGSIPHLAICEGLEDALSVMELTGYPAWAVCGAHNYRHQQIPESIHEVVIAADSDEVGLSAARMLAQRLINEGRVVRIKPPPDGCKDWNDYLKKKKADAVTPATIK
ncbi:MAG: toprim domain-containing protein [Rickettsiales bacterium]|nr:toprim domain-containing protein [Rickettsiales bacterium]